MALFMLPLQLNAKGINMKKLMVLIATIAAAGCSSSTVEKDYDAEVVRLINSDFKSKGSVQIEKFVQQDEVQKLCSQDGELSQDALASIRDSQVKTVKYPADDQYLGDWEKGIKIANNGKGGQFSDKPGSVSGGNCFGCHQITKEEVAFGTMGPSLYQYGKLRGNSKEIYQYTWAKIYNAQASIACSNMPRFGHAGILTEEQIKDLMALLLDPESPTNK